MSRRGWALLLALALGVLGCATGGRHASACPDGGCPVPPPYEYVPLCHDVTGGVGPCVDQVAESGMWVSVPAGQVWPVGRTVAPCATGDGATASDCVWVPSVMGERDAGDSGAYLYL